jgi:hypothetical protein
VELRDILSKKPVKFLTLLLTAMLIATASAAVYYSISMQPTVTISQATVIFEQGDDWPGGSMGANSTYASLTIKAYPNATLTYDEPLNISNTDSSDHSVRLSHLSINPANLTASVSNFTFINFTLIQPNGNPVTGSDFDYTTSGDNWITPSDMGYQTLLANTDWAVKIETRAAAGATNATTCTIVIAVDVQE